MKNFLISLLVILITGCTNQAPKPLTDAEKETIKNQVKKEFNAMVEACNKADLNNALLFFWDSPGFICIDSEGSILNYAQFKKSWEDYFGTITGQKSSTIKEDIKILENNLVVYAWQARFEMYLKTGEKMTFSNFGMSSLFKKIDGLWKIIYFQQSELSPVVTKL